MKDDAKVAQEIARKIDAIVRLIADDPQLNPTVNGACKWYGVGGAGLVLQRKSPPQIAVRSHVAVTGKRLSIEKAQNYLRALEAGCLAPPNDENTTRSYAINAHDRACWLEWLSHKNSVASAAMSEAESALRKVRRIFGQPEHWNVPKKADADPTTPPELEWRSAGEDGFAIAYCEHVELSVSPDYNSGVENQWIACLGIHITDQEAIEVAHSYFQFKGDDDARARAERLPYKQTNNAVKALLHQRERDAREREPCARLGCGHPRWIHKPHCKARGTCRDPNCGCGEDDKACNCPAFVEDGA